MSNPFISLLHTAWLYAKSQRHLFYLSYGLLVLANIVMVLQPVLYGIFIDALQKDGLEAIRYAWIYVAAHFGAFIVYYALHGPGRLLELKLAFAVGRNFLEMRFSDLMHLGLDWHKNNHSGSIINRLKKGHTGLTEFVKSGFQYSKTIVQLSIPAAAIIYYSPMFAVIAITTGAMVIAVIYKFDKPYVESLAKMNEKEHKVIAFILDTVSNILTVVSLRLQKRMRFEASNKMDSMYSSYRQNITINEWKWFCANLLIKIVYCVIIIGYVYEHANANEAFQIGGLVALVGFTHQFNNAFVDIALQYNQVVQHHTDLRTADVLQSETKKNTGVLSETFPTDWNELTITNLTFAYPNKEDHQPAEDLHNRLTYESHNASSYLFDGLQLRIMRGQKIALIGASGCGKSTLMSVLKGFYSPQPSSTLAMDDKQYSWSCLHENVALFPQRPEIFENTLIYNITMGVGHSDLQISRACEIAGLDHVIKSLPQGLNTMVNEDGVNLSGGQKQRLALARGILAAANSEIILLDEPTSSIDPKMEAQIYNGLFGLFSHKTIIAGIHGLHLLRYFDYVYILKDGTIIQEGSADEIIKLNVLEYY
jgi:ABC-type multidrug transport system fused ATPase/permease subunit